MSPATPPPGPPSMSNTGSSTRPYLIRALHDWCTDNGFTPYVAVFVDASVQVPVEYVKNNEIVLNIGFEATSALKLGNDYIEFKARFGGTSRDILVPVDHVIAIYARENGQGMAFPAPTPAAAASEALVSTDGPSSGRGPKLSLASTEASSDSSFSPDIDDDVADENSPEPPTEPPSGGRPALKRVK